MFRWQWKINWSFRKYYDSVLSTVTTVSVYIYSYLGYYFTVRDFQLCALLLERFTESSSRVQFWVQGSQKNWKGFGSKVKILIQKIRIKIFRSKRNVSKRQKSIFSWMVWVLRKFGWLADLHIHQDLYGSVDVRLTSRSPFWMKAQGLGYTD